MCEEVICAGDVVQIDPNVKEFGTMLAVVNDTFKWGIHAYICMRQEGEEPPVIFLSLQHDQYELIEGEVIWEPAGVENMVNIDEDEQVTELENANVIPFNPNLILCTAYPYLGTEEQNKQYNILHTDEGPLFEISSGEYIIINLHDAIVVDKHTEKYYVINKILLFDILDGSMNTETETFLIDRHIINLHMKDRLNNVHI